MSNYIAEFPGFKLDVEIPHGFHDSSWHHDESPSWQNDDLGLKIYIAEPGQLQNRFCLLEKDENEFYAKVILLTNDWQKLLEAIEVIRSPNWNLYLEKLGNNRYKIIMPNQDGSFDGIPIPKDGFSLRWMVNPWSTGQAGIANILQSTNDFASATFTY